MSRTTNTAAVQAIEIATTATLATVGEVWVASQRPRPPPRPAPPRLPAWNQPAARPSWSRGTWCAISASTAMPSVVAARLDASTMISSTPIVSARTGTSANAPSAEAPIRFETMYQRRRLNVTSVSGAHRNFQVCGKSASAPSAAACSAGTPSRAARVAIATEMKPPPIR